MKSHNTQHKYERFFLKIKVKRSDLGNQKSFFFICLRLIYYWFIKNKVKKVNFLF